MARVAIAVDVGGTGIKCALVDDAGEFRYVLRRTTGRDDGPDAVLSTILGTAEELAAPEQLVAMFHLEPGGLLGVGELAPREPRRVVGRANHGSLTTSQP